MPACRTASVAAAAVVVLAIVPSFGRAAAPPPLAATSPATLAATLADTATVESLPGGFAVVTPQPFTAPADAVDPIYRKPFSRAVYIYAPGAGGRLIRRVILHHEPEARDDARRAARLCARLLRLHHERFGRDARFPRDADEAQVWLLPEQPGHAESGAPLGGETRDASVYIFGTATRRAPLEWVRTIAHEWGHLTLPAARGFTDPESDAAGFLGERLHFKWLRADTLAGKAGAPDDFTTPEGVTLYCRRQVTPLIERFATGGPSAKALDGAGTAAMDYYCGAVLACDDAFGSELTGRALFTIEDIHPRDFVNAMASVVARADAVSVRLPAWVPLSRTRYQVAPAPGGGSGELLSGRASVIVTGHGGGTLRVSSSGWTWVRAASAGLTSVVLRPATPRPEEGR